VMKNTGKQHAAPPITANNPAPAGGEPSTPGGNAPAPNQPATSSPDQAAQPAPTTPPQAGTALAGLHAKVFAGDPLAANFAPVGSLDAPGRNPLAPHLKIEFDDFGAGVRELRLADHYESVTNDANVLVQTAIEHNGVRLVPFAAQWLSINGQKVFLTRDATGPVWRQVAADKPGHFEALILDDKDTPIARVERRYLIRPNSHVVQLGQRVENLSAQALTISLVTYGPADLPQERGGYGGDKRKVRFGYLRNAGQDPSRKHPIANEFITPHQTAMGGGENGLFEPVAPQ